jgi:putative transposase
LVRKPRIWFPGAIYHNTARGVRKSDLFLENADRERYILLLKQTKEVHPFNLFSYCLMTNHVHLLIETLHTNTGTIFNYLHTKYAKYFNKKYELSGHVFENRYGAELIDSYQYLLDASRYIHLNPIKANLVTTIEEYRWSSLPYYITNNSNEFVSTNRILSNFPAPQVENYLTFLNTPSTNPPETKLDPNYYSKQKLIH